MDNQQPTNKPTTSSLPGAVIFVGGMAIAISVLMGIFFLIKYFKPNPPANLDKTPVVAQKENVPAPIVPTQNTQTAQQAPTAANAPLPTLPPAKRVEVQTCTLTKETSTLVDKLMKFDNGLSGTFRGVATKVAYTKEKQLAILEVTSRDMTHVHTFDVQADNIRLKQLTKSTIDISEDLHVGSPIIIGFKCSPKYDNKFIITFIQTAAD